MLRRRYASPRPRRARCPRSSPRARQHTCGRGERRRRGEHMHAEHWTQSSAAYLLISSVRRLRLRYARMARLMAMIAPRATSPILRFRAASRASCACVAAVTAQRFAEVACSMAAIRGHQRSSEVIRGHQRSSEAIRGHQRSSEVIDETHLLHGRLSHLPRLRERIRGCRPRSRGSRCGGNGLLCHPNGLLDARARRGAHGRPGLLRRKPRHPRASRQRGALEH